MPTPPHVVWMPGGLRTEIHLTRDDTGGAFCLLADEPPAGWSLPPHRHEREAETIHIIRGEFEMKIAGRRRHLAPGETIHIPRGVVHSGANLGRETGRRIVTFNPAGLEDFFLEVGQPAEDEEIDASAALSSARQHGWRFET